MNRIAKQWDQLRSRGAKALVPYVTPEYPVAGSTVELILALERAGAAFVEVGIPFSDPLADGPVIQRASQIALKNGATLKRVLGVVRDVRETSDIPLLLMGYANPIIRTGPKAFMAQVKEAGADGLIIPDLPPGEAGDVHAAAVGHGLSMVYLIAPTTPDERIRDIDRLSTDFSYCVSITGVTGASSRFAADDSFADFLSRVRRNVTKPFVVGFGISSSEDVTKVWRYADGAVVGSRLLQAIGDCRTATEVTKKGSEFFATLLPHAAMKDPAA